MSAPSLPEQEYSMVHQSYFNRLNDVNAAV